MMTHTPVFISIVIASIMCLPLAAAKITITPAELQFPFTAVGDESPQQSYLIEGDHINRNHGVTISPPPGFKISLVSGGPYQGTTIQMYPDASKIINTNIFVVFAPPECRTYTEEIVHTSPSAKASSLRVTGAGTPIPPQSLEADTIDDSQIELYWSLNSNNDPVLIAQETVDSFGTPVTGIVYAVHDVLSGGGAIIYSGSDTSVMDNGLNPNTVYYYQTWSFSGVAVPGGPFYSEPLASSAATMPESATGLVLLGCLGAWVLRCLDACHA